MSVLNEALEFLGLTGDSRACNDRCELAVTRTRREQRELAERMRRLPGRFADRLSARTIDEVGRTAAAGRWEHAVDELIIALHTSAEFVTDQEREELRALLEALDMPGERLDALLRTSQERGIRR